MDGKTVKKFVRERYAGIARQGTSCCGPEASCGCGGEPETGSLKIGYSSEEIGAVPPGADLGLGCGNPVALASLRKERLSWILDPARGSTVFLAARAVGPEGKVIGVDMTPDMIEKAGGTPKKGNIEMSSSGSGRSRIFRRPTIPWTQSSPTASSISPGQREGLFGSVSGPQAGRAGDDLGHRSCPELPEAVAGSVAAYAGCVAGLSGKRNTSVSWRRPVPGRPGRAGRAGPILRRARRQAP